MGSLTSYISIHDREKEGVDDPDSDDEASSDCEAALMDPKETQILEPSRGRLHQAIQKILQVLRILLQYLLPSFLLPVTDSDEPRRLHPTAWLDGLRGIASLLVVIHHASLLGFSWEIHDGWAPDRHQTAWFIRLPIIRLLISGPPQVAIFFVVSGYAISHKALKLSHQGRFAEAGSSLFSSVFRRHPRLFLPAGIVVLCTALMTLLDPTWFGTNGFPNVAVPTRTVPQAKNLIGQLRNWYDAEIQSTRPISNGFYEQADPHVKQNPFDPNLWTLPMEFSSSMVVFLFLVACIKLHNRVRMGLALSLIIYLQYYFDFPALHMFLSGMLICDLHFDIADMLSTADPRSDTFILSVWARVRRTVVSRAVAKFKHSYMFGRAVGLSMFIFALWLLSTPELTYGPHESWGYMTISSWVSPWYGDHFLSPYGAILVLGTACEAETATRSPSQNADKAGSG
ncbi:hypothetical protein N0V93_001609 [Gnomoniopsis smithogilvyi]|uniref:Acyltransferase 3 domain-containing protein n=1 Tax=Gnomoniopsis smithogilvyi TaxID=1191159 RepID=A0A9W9D1U5_9PEZI|nr:hypothetical protein N0V93_001609 [Gnomoniopsis smithogilvyi]